MAKKTASAKDYKTQDIDRLFEKASKGLEMTGTGYNPSKKKAPAKKKVKRK